MRRVILIPFLIFVVLFAITGGVIYYLYQNYLYYQTDDAQVSGNIVPITALANGQLVALNVKPGDKVTAGQTIASIQPAQLAPLAGSTTPATPTTPTKAIDITSPINGTILTTPVVQNQTVSAGLPLAQVTDLSAVTITANIDETAINNIKIGQDADIHIDAYSDTAFSGKVQQIIKATASSFSLLPTQDTASSNFTKVGQRIPVIITLNGTAGKDIVPGMSAEVSIHIH